MPVLEGDTVRSLLPLTSVRKPEEPQGHECCRVLWLASNILKGIFDETNSPMFVYYRPQRSCGQGNIFAPVCHSVHGGGVSVEQTPQSRPPSGSRHTPRADPPEQTTPPWEQTHTPPEQTPPPEQTRPPPREAVSGIQSTSGRYASYWNAFLFV